MLAYNKRVSKATLRNLKFSGEWWTLHVLHCSNWTSKIKQKNLDIKTFESSHRNSRDRVTHEFPVSCFVIILKRTNTNTVHRRRAVSSANSVTRLGPRQNINKKIGCNAKTAARGPIGFAAHANCPATTKMAASTFDWYSWEIKERASQYLFDREDWWESSKRTNRLTVLFLYFSIFVSFILSIYPSSNYHNCNYIKTSNP